MAGANLLTGRLAKTGKSPEGKLFLDLGGKVMGSVCIEKI